MREIDTDSLQEFLIEAVPSFREECLSNRAILGDVDSFYLLLADFRKHILRLFAEDRESDSFKSALSAIDALLRDGDQSVKDATVIQVIDLMIKDEGLRAAASASGLAFLSSSIESQVQAWQEFRQNRPARRW
jgi:hypothetical protein